MKAVAIKTVATNRKAYHNYHLEDTVEAGIVLTGTEIKSIRAGRVSLSDAYVKPEAGELWLVNAHIARYEAGSYLSQPHQQGAGKGPYPGATQIIY
jgi:SsrA-binding protein